MGGERKRRGGRGQTAGLLAASGGLARSQRTEYLEGCCDQDETLFRSLRLEVDRRDFYRLRMPPCRPPRNP